VVARLRYIVWWADVGNAWDFEGVELDVRGDEVVGSGGGGQGEVQRIGRFDAVAVKTSPLRLGRTRASAKMRWLDRKLLCAD
jgi:hypothetical protein